MSYLLLLGGLVLLVAGAEALVRGASRLAAALGIAPLVIGLTIVAFGTSSPELAVSIKAALSGQASIALGNVVGSNIFNVLFILGLSALITPLAVAALLVRRDVPLMIGVSALTLLFALDGVVGRVEGLLLVAGLIAYTTHLVRASRRESGAVAGEFAREFGAAPAEGRLRQLGLIAAGLALLVLGSSWLVDGAVRIAQGLGVSELVIGLTIIAAGTSMPEVVTSVVASLRGERDIAVGNVVGSNLFNLLGVLGVASMIAPDGMAVAPAALRFDIPVMTAVAFACLPIFFTGGGISRWEGALLLGYYVAYTAYLILAATQHAALPVLSAALLWFALPLTAVTLAVVAWRAWRAPRGQP